MITFGPVPSRRLGKSLGINNIPPKICSYGCVYCQIGKSIKIQIKREKFYEPEKIYEEVKKTIENLKQQGEKIDYLSFVPDGEPTLDINLGKEIEMLKEFGIPIAVITNGSLLWQQEVRDELMNADLVNVKVDAITPEVWKKLDKPHKDLDIEKILNGILIFASVYPGILYTETMLVKGKNDFPQEIDKIAEFIAQVQPHTAYIGIPTRPPAEPVEPADEQTLNYAYNVFKNKLDSVELLIGTDPGQFAASKNPIDEILSITSVHPMSFDALDKFLLKYNIPWKKILELIEQGELIETTYQGKKFYLRKLKK